MTHTTKTPVALVTGGSAGLGRALVAGLTARGWYVVTDGRDADRLATLADLPHHERITAIRGDLTDEHHRTALLAAVAAHGRLDLHVNNASTLGPPSGDRRYRRLGDLTIDDVGYVWRQNVGGPLVLTGLALPHLVSSQGILMSLSSDAAIDHCAGFGLYGAGKAALDHLTLTFAVENPGIRAYAVDPGDMRTAMHQDWFPDEDISDRPLPQTVVPHLLGLLERRPPSGRYRAADLPTVAPGAQEVA